MHAGLGAPHKRCTRRARLAGCRRRYGPWHGSAFAASDEEAEKEAFEAAKGLGTVEAFLTHYPNGFRADLARAYVKKLADQPQAAPSPPSPPTAASAGSTNDDFPAAAGSWAASCATDRASNIAGSAAWPKVSPSR